MEGNCAGGRGYVITSNIDEDIKWFVSIRSDGRSDGILIQEIKLQNGRPCFLQLHMRLARFHENNTWRVRVGKADRTSRNEESRRLSGLMVAKTLYDWLRKALVKFRPIPRFDPASRISNCWFSRSICIGSGDILYQ
jgi:hypothetical protein